jgi:hypothetical protein
MGEEFTISVPEEVQKIEEREKKEKKVKKVKNVEPDHTKADPEPDHTKADPKPDHTKADPEEDKTEYIRRPFIRYATKTAITEYRIEQLMIFINNQLDNAELLI